MTDGLTTFPTPLSMPAVTIESRLKAVEDYILTRPGVDDKIRSELRAEMAAIRSDYQLALAAGLAEEAKKREAFEARIVEIVGKVDAKVDKVDGKVDVVDAKMGEQTTMLENLVVNVGKLVTALGGAVSNPVYVKAFGTILVALAAITTWYASHLKGVPVQTAPMTAPPVAPGAAAP